MSQEKQKRHSPRVIKVLLIAAILLAALGVILSGLLALFVVPAPAANTAVELSGRLNRINPPHPEYGDLTISLVDGRSYYVNRADEVDYFEWERLIEEVRPGDTVILTVVRPLAWRLLGSLDAPGLGPVAGVRTDSTIYMDPAISAATWTAQSTFAHSTFVLLALLVGLVILSRRMLGSL